MSKMPPTTRLARLPAEEVCAVYLADDQQMRPTGLPWMSCDTARLLQYLRTNKVPLLAIHSSSRSFDGHMRGEGPDQALAILSDPLFEQARDVEANELAAMRLEYRWVHDALASEGISGVFIKPVGISPSFPFKSDNLDILYKPEDVERVRQTLYRLGYIELTNMEEPHKYLFRKFHAGRPVSAIHVHEHVGWVTSFVNEEELWQRCRRSSDDDLVTIPAPEDALLTNLAHWFIEDKRLTLHDLIKCTHCLREGIDWNRVFRVAGRRGWRDGLNVSLVLLAYAEGALYGNTLVPSDVLTEAWQGIPFWAKRWLLRLTTPERAGTPRPADVPASALLPLRIPFWFSKGFSYAKFARDPSRSTRRRVKDITTHTAYGIKLRLHIHSQPAMLVAFSGTDGCGKTTQARALQSAFRTCHLRADHSWNRGGSAGWISLLNRLIGHQRQNHTSLDTEARVLASQEQLRSPWKRWAWSWLTTLELLGKYTLRVTFPLLAGRVVICDRYVADTLADWSAYFGEDAVEKRLAARTLRLLTPKPHLAYWLDVSPAVAQGRSSDGLPAWFLATLSTAYARLAQSPSDHSGSSDTVTSHRPSGQPTAGVLQKVDGSQGWEEISDAIVHEVLTAYFANYHTTLNSIFQKNPGQWR
jgi:thymidylate kinase